MSQQYNCFIKILFTTFFLLFVFFNLPVLAAQVTLKWVSHNVSAPDGYNLYQRIDDQAHDYTQPVNSIPITDAMFTVTALIEGHTYHFVVRAIIGDKETSDSNEVSYTVPISNPDSDDDGYKDNVDAFPYDDTEWWDTDGDGVGNHADMDDDGDGLPDTWEDEYELDPLDDADAYGDLDGDGISNLDEYANGTDPSQVPGNTPPDRPVLIMPADGAVDVELMPLLMTEGYVDADGDAHSRTLYQIATSTDWNSDLVFACEFTKQLTNAIVGDLILEPETKYYWRVRFYDQKNGRSEWSEVYSFVTIDNVTAGFVDDDGDGILNDQEIAEEDIDPELGAIEDMVVVGSSDEINPQLGIVISSDAEIVTVRSADPDYIEVGNNANRPDVITGVVSFKVLLFNEATSASVTVSLSTPAPENAIWYKYSIENGWMPYSDVTFSKDRKSITIHLVDGGPGDDDGIQNGIIVDPSGLGYSSPDENPEVGTKAISPRTKNGGCFISAALGENSVERQYSPILIALSMFGVGVLRAMYPSNFK